MDAPPVGDYHIRISPEAFVIALALSLSVAFIFAALRTFIRWQQYRKRDRKPNQGFHLDDVFLFYAVIVSGICAGVVYSIRDQIYLQIYVGLKWQPIEPDFYDVMLVFEKRIMICSALIWSVIYAIKFSFLVFFRKLVQRVSFAGFHWWFVAVITTLCAGASIPLSFIVCEHFGSDYMTYCPIDRQLANERIYLGSTTGLDVLTDLLIISIPIRLFWNLKLSWQHKAVLTAMLCMSAFCVIVAIVRTCLAVLPNGIIDTSWLVFWQGVEAAMSVVVVSCPTFLSLFGEEGLITRRRRTRRARASGSSVDVEKAEQSSLTFPPKASLSPKYKEWDTSSGTSDTSDLDREFHARPPTYLAIPHAPENESTTSEKDHIIPAGNAVSDEQFEETKVHSVPREACELPILVQEKEVEREGDGE